MPFDDPASLLQETRWVRALARRLVGDVHLADDLAQETWCAALATESVPAEACRRRRWLAGVVHNLVRMERRASRRRKKRESLQGEPEPQSEPSAVVQQTELQQRVVAGVMALPEPYRTTLLLRYVRELTTAAVARQTRVAEPTVRVRVHRALELLRRDLDRNVGRGWQRGVAILAGGSTTTPLPLPLAAAPNALLLGVGMKIALKIGVATAAVLVAWILWPQGEPTPLPQPSPPYGATAAAQRATVPDDKAVTPGRRPAAIEDPSAVAPTGEDDVASGATLSGRVLDTGGQPIGGAEVLVFPRRLYGASAGVTVTDTPQRVMTDGDGAFAFGDLGPSLEYGLYAGAGGFAPVAMQSRPRYVEITLRPACRVFGRVLEGGTGTPIAGASVRSRRPRWDGESLVLVRESVTGPDGRYELEGMPRVAATAQIGFEVLAPGYGPLTTWLSISKAEVEHDIVLEPERVVSATVVDAGTGAPVGGAVIASGGLAPHELARTDANGRFSLQLLREPVDSAIRMLRRGNRRFELAEPDLLTVSAPGYCLTVQPAFDLIEAEGEARVELLPGARIEGVVLHADESPAVEAVVEWLAHGFRGLTHGAWAEPASGSSLARTRADGTFVLAHVPWGIAGAALGVRHRGTQERVDDVAPVGPSAVRRIEIRLGAGVTVRGRTFVNGEPAKCYVKLVGPGGPEGGWTKVTDDDGTFAIHGVPPGDYSVSSCTGDGTAIWSEPRSLSVSRPIAPLELHISAALDRIGGRLVRASGEAIEGFDVMAFEENKDENAQGLRIVAGMATTDAEGRFEIKVKPAANATYYLIAAAGSFTREVHGVRAGEVDLRMVIPDLGAVTLRIEDSEGEPVSTAVVRCRLPGEDWLRLFGGSETSTERGVIRTRMPVGNLEIEVSSPQNGLAARTVQAFVLAEHDTEVVIRL